MFEAARLLRPPPGAAAGTEAFKPLKSRLALGVDLAAVEGAALLLVADDLISRTHLSEFFLRLGIGALIRMIFFGELAKRLLDLARVGGFRNAQNRIRIAHL